MKHLGDITKLHGWDMPVVDVITGGSPCQDLSTAGLRAGLAGERSSLFLEQIRIVKEMREYDKAHNGRNGSLVRPRWLVWENVEGAFSSSGGKDFQRVLTEIVRIVRPDAPDVPLPQGGRWAKSGALMGYGIDGCSFSVAYRLHDAQFWGATQYVDGRMLTRGTPQRRRRVALVADFGGIGASEVLFVRKGLYWDSPQSGEAREETAGSAESCARKTSESDLNIFAITSQSSNSMKSSNPNSGIYETDVAKTIDQTGGGPGCNQGGIAIVEKKESV